MTDIPGIAPAISSARIDEPSQLVEEPAAPCPLSDRCVAPVGGDTRKVSHCLHPRSVHERGFTGG